MWRATNASVASSSESVAPASPGARVRVSFIVIVAARRASSFVADRRFVRLRVEQPGERTGVGGLQLEEPRGVGVLIDLLGRLRERRVHGDDLARDRRIDVG